MLKAENYSINRNISKHSYIIIRNYAMVRIFLKRKHCDEIRNYGIFSTCGLFAPGKKGRL